MWVVSIMLHFRSFTVIRLRVECSLCDHISSTTIGPIFSQRQWTVGPLTFNIKSNINSLKVNMQINGHVVGVVVS